MRNPSNHAFNRISSFSNDSGDRFMIENPTTITPDMLHDGMTMLQWFTSQNVTDNFGEPFHVGSIVNNGQMTLNGTVKFTAYKNLQPFTTEWSNKYFGIAIYKNNPVLFPFPFWRSDENKVNPIQQQIEESGGETLAQQQRDFYTAEADYSNNIGIGDVQVIELKKKIAQKNNLLLSKHKSNKKSVASHHSHADGDNLQDEMAANLAQAQKNEDAQVAAAQKAADVKAAQKSDSIFGSIANWLGLNDPPAYSDCDGHSVDNFEFLNRKK